MSELKREQIIKALECCTKDDCDNCPNTFGNCYSNLAGYALSLIKELTDEKETLASRLVTIHDMAVKKERELTEENERLRAEGEWIEKNPEDALYRYTCSLCGKTRLGKKTPYCANCGAKMKGE